MKISYTDLIPYLFMLGRVAVTLVLGCIALRLVGKLTRRLAAKNFSAQVQMLLGKALYYSVWIILMLSIVQELGFNISALLGAAGVAGVALGFASQTSVSNIISGLFIISEQSFALDDIVRIGDVEGFVVAIDLLSIKIRTYNNSYVRIPHESIIKNPVYTITRFADRRFDFVLGVAYKENIRTVIDVLTDVIKKSKYNVADKEPSIVVQEFADSEIKLAIGVWVHKQHWNALRKTLPIEVKERFDREGIEIPFPQLIVYSK